MHFDPGTFPNLYGLFDATEDIRGAVQYSLEATEQGSPTDNHHPGISADGRYVAYLEESEEGCFVHIYDRRTEAYIRSPCPEKLEESIATDIPTVPEFSEDGSVLYWYILDNSGTPASQVHGYRLPNPLGTGGK